MSSRKPSLLHEIVHFLFVTSEEKTRILSKDTPTLLSVCKMASFPTISDTDI
jgi:hypothetical protein